MLSLINLINLQSTKNQSAKEGDPRRQPHSSENWCRPAGLDSFPLCFPALTCRAFLCRRFAPGAMAQSVAPSKLSVNQLSQSPPRKFIHHPVVPSSLDQDFTGPIAEPDQRPAFLLASTVAPRLSSDRPVRAARSTLAPDARLEP